jgi:hypothetical protein
MDAGISEADLPTYITANGGVDKCGKVITSSDAKREHTEYHKKLRAAATYQLSTQQALGKVTFNSQVMPTLPAAADVSFIHGLIRRNHLTGELELVSTLYPSSEIEEKALYLQLLCCRAAATRKHNDMYSFCKENGLNVDIMHRWMASNNIANAEIARQRMAELKQHFDNPSRKPSNLKAA